MLLYMIRHAHALDVGGQIASDALRPLSDKGVRIMELVARGLGELACAPAIIFTSPLIRAVQTAEIAGETLQPEHGMVPDTHLSPGAYATNVAALFAGTDFAEAMIVGHAPDFGLIAGQFIGAGDCIEFKKAAVACVQFNGRPAPGAGMLNWLIPPKVFCRE